MGYELEDLLPFLLFGTIFLLIGLAALVKQISDRKKARENCTLPVTAKCTRISDGSEYQIDPVKAAQKGREETFYRVAVPVFEIQYNGQTVELGPKIYSNIVTARVGEIRDIFINPNNPQDYYDPTVDKSIFARVGLFVALGFIAFGVAFIAVPTYILLTQA